MKGIAPVNLEKIGGLITSKTGAAPPNQSNKFGKGKKKKHLQFNFGKTK